MNRRTFLSGLSGLSALPGLSGLAMAARRPRLRPALRPAARSAPQSAPRSAPVVLPWADIEPLPPGVRARYTDLTRLTGEVVPNEEFFVLDHSGVPELPPADFRLELGHPGAPPRQTLTAADLRTLPRAGRIVAFECCGNGGVGMHGLVGAARWEGTPLAPLLEPLLRPDSREVVCFGADAATERLRGNAYPARFARSLPLRDALAPEVLLADTMNGEPLPAEHGGPLRLVVPGHYGIAQVKWVTRIEVWPSRFAGWYQAKDYVTVRGVETPAGIEHRATQIARMRLKSLVTRVERAPNGVHTIRGLAWNDGRSPIHEVAVRLDDADFRPALLTPTEHPYGLRRFHLPWPDPAPGDHRLTSRAADAGGLQPTAEAASRYKATPWENNGQVTRRLRLAETP